MSLPDKTDWGYLGRWVARKLDIDEDAGIYAVMGQMHSIVGDAKMMDKFVRLQKVAMSQQENAELLNLRKAVMQLAER